MITIDRMLDIAKQRHVEFDDQEQTRLRVIAHMLDVWTFRNMCEYKRLFGGRIVKVRFKFPPAKKEIM